MGSPVLRAGVTALLVLGFAEAAARLGLALVAPHAYEVARNPHAGLWQQYTAPRARRPDERLVILLTNSQGHTRSDALAQQLYPVRLEALLNQADPRQGYIVANWAYPGASGHDLIVFAARAAAHRPDAVLLVTYSRNFTYVLDGQVLEDAGTDVHHLAYRRQVRRHLSPWFVRQFHATHPHAWLAAHSRLAQLHETVVALVKGRVAADARPALTRAAPWTDSADRLLEELYQTLRNGLPETPLLIISMPVGLDHYTPESPPHLAEFARQATVQFGRRPGVMVLDASTLLEPRLCSDETHLEPEGHALFAEWLFPHVLRMVERAR